MTNIQQQLKELIDNGDIIVQNKFIGCCRRSFIQLPNDTHKYYYNYNKKISKKLEKKFSSYIYTMSNKTLNKNQIEVKIKYNNDESVDDDKFKDFIKEYRILQETKQNPLELEFQVIVEGKDKETKYTHWYPRKTIYGGIQGIKAYIRKVGIELINKYAFAYNNKEIEKIILTDIFIKNKKNDVKLTFDEIKMYGTKFDYCGYQLLALEPQKPNSCVPEYLYQLYYNPNEINPRKRIAKLTMERLLEILEMKSIDEGCSIKQISKFCDMYKITFYSLDKKYKTVLTNAHKEYKTNLPRLIFMCANNHLYPIEDKSKRETIFKKNANTGIKKIKATQDKIEIEEHVKLNTYTCHYEIELYNLLDQHKNTQQFVKIITTSPNLCNKLFYDELIEGRIHNEAVKINETGKVIRFIYNKIVIEEDPYYASTNLFINLLNQEINKVADTFLYNGQSPHRIAYEYYVKLFNKNIFSNCSPQVYEIMCSNTCMNSPFTEFYKNQGQVAYDVNKQYTSILSKGDKYGWALYSPMDKVEPFDGKIQTGFYFITTENYKPLKGNGWYCDYVVDKAINLKIINKENIIYQLKSSHVIPSDNFYDFIRKVYYLCEVFEDIKYAKTAINGFIGMLGKTQTKQTNIYFGSYDDIADEIAHNDNIEIKGIYKNKDKDLYNINILNSEDDLDNALINAVNNDNVEPVIYQFNDIKKINMYKNTLPIHRKIYDKANMDMYEIHLQIQELNPEAELVGIKTDCLVYNNIKTDPPLSNLWGDIKKCNVPLINECVLNNSPKIRTDIYQLTNQTWNYIKPDDIYNYLDKGILITGAAGTGKTVILNKIKKKINELEYRTTCPTHKACKLIKGITLHRLFGINPIDNSYEYGKAWNLYKSGVRYILIDEISMINSEIWNVIAQIQEQFEFIIIGFGDWAQLPPVNEEHIDFSNAWIVNKIFNGNRCELEYIHRFNDSHLKQDTNKCRNGEKIDFNKYGSKECNLSLCWTNSAVNKLNQKWNEYYSKDIEKKETVNGYQQTKFILHEGLKIMAYKSYGKKYYNSEEFVVKSFDQKNIILSCDDMEFEIEKKQTVHFKPVYAMTVHKAQGITIEQAYSIYEYEKMSFRMLYVALSRTREKEYVNFCKIDIYKPYVSYIYKLWYDEYIYIGSTNNLKYRLEQHKNEPKGKLKIFNEIIGFDKLQKQIIEKINYSDIEEVYELEKKYINEYRLTKTLLNEE
jgi:hypothetical protein